MKILTRSQARKQKMAQLDKKQICCIGGVITTKTPPPKPKKASTICKQAKLKSRSKPVKIVAPPKPKPKPKINLPPPDHSHVMVDSKTCLEFKIVTADHETAFGPLFTH